MATEVIAESAVRAGLHVELHYTLGLARNVIDTHIFHIHSCCVCVGEQASELAGTVVNHNEYSRELHMRRTVLTGQPGPTVDARLQHPAQTLRVNVAPKCREESVKVIAHLPQYRGHRS